MCLCTRDGLWSLFSGKLEWCDEAAYNSPPTGKDSCCYSSLAKLACCRVRVRFGIFMVPSRKSLPILFLLGFNNVQRYPLLLSVGCSAKETSPPFAASTRSISGWPSHLELFLWSLIIYFIFGKVILSYYYYCCALLQEARGRWGRLCCCSLLSCSLPVLPQRRGQTLPSPQAWGTLGYTT